jgi:hypothetical protein
MSTFSSKIEMKNGKLVVYLPHDITEPIVKQGIQRVICRVSENDIMHCAINAKHKEPFIYIHREIVDKYKLSPGEKISLDIHDDESQFQFQFPEELSEVFQTDEEAFTIFKQLTTGNQRGLIHLIAKIKSSQKRIDKSIHLADQLKGGITSVKQVFRST